MILVGDLLVSFTPTESMPVRETFPARDGRTTYLLPTWMLTQIASVWKLYSRDYLRLMPEYQEITRLQLQRALFGFFPRTGKVHCGSPWSRILPVGDKAATNPLELWFGAMVRHLKRLTVGIHEAF